jgi:hypothetical protein
MQPLDLEARRDGAEPGTAAHPAGLVGHAHQWPGATVRVEDIGRSVLHASAAAATRCAVRGDVRP